MKKNIWFNHWFSTCYNFINLIKNNPNNEEFVIYATNLNPYSPIKKACDFFDIEPNISNKDYIKYCLEFCKKNKIAVFIPRHEILSICENINLFHEIGTKVMLLEDLTLLKTLNNKSMFYDSIKKNNVCELPKYKVVNTYQDFVQAYKELSSEGFRVCFKPLYSEGAFGFRVIDNAANSIKNLLGPINYKVSFEEVQKILSYNENFNDIMVSEYLEGDEYSIDCLSFNDIFIAVPRKKMEGRVRFLEDNQDLIHLAKDINDTYKIPYIYNIQIKYSNGVPKMLEINPRMSGGLYLSCMSGVNFPYIAIKLLLGDTVSINKPILNTYTTYIETGVLL